MPDGRATFLRRFLGEAKAAEFDVPPGPLGWLVDLWADAGQARVVLGPEGGVLFPLGWPELVAWLDGAQEHSLSPTFRRAILQLSAAYAETANGAREVEYPAPHDPGKGEGNGMGG
jgi:hypothetical protein